MNINGREIKSIVHLHNHTDYSLLDSVLKVKSLVKFAKDHELPAIAITDHGDFSGFVNFYKECKKNNIKPILGSEIYEVEDYEENKNKRNHLILLAKNEKGFKNISKILTIGAENFHTKPIITVQDIMKNGLGDGIICLTACLGSRLARGLRDGKDMRGFMKDLKSTFDEVYVEIQAHNTEDQIDGNNKLIKFAKENGFPLVVSTDAHMLNEEDSYYHDLFVSIGQGREVGEHYTDCYLQNIKQTVDVMKKTGVKKDIFVECVENTYNIADMIEEYPIGLENDNQMPHVEIPAIYKNSMEYFRYLVYKGMDEKIEKYGLNKKEYYERIELEIEILDYVSYIDYLLLMRQAVLEAKNRKIPMGYARGSAGGCLCVYALDISKVDSIKWGLNFARFANKGRKNSLADIDLDCSQKRRHELIELTKDMFGHDRVAPMATFGTFTTKSAIRDIGKVLNDRIDSPYYQQIPSSLRKEVMNMIPTIKTFDDITGEGEDKEMALNDILNSNSNLKEINSKFPKWMEAVLKLEGLIKTRGIHASGILVSPKPLSDYAPLVRGKDEGMVFCLEMHNAQDDIKLVKLDYLGLRNLDIVDETIKSVGKTWDDFDIDNMNLDDKDVLREIFEKSNSEGVFQCESLEARKMLSQMRFDTIDDVIAVLALNRPGAKDSFPQYIENQKFSYQDKVVVHEDLRPIFAPTQGILLYQEQALSVFAFSGFPEEEVDIARRCLDENTLITMSNGTRKKIKDIKIGDTVPSYNKNGSCEIKNVTNVFDNGVADTFEIKTQHGNSIIGTSSHKVLTCSGWKKIGDLTTDDYIMTPKKIVYSYKNQKQTKKPNANSMFALGLLIGDGSISKKGTVKFTNHEDELVEKYKECVNSMIDKSRTSEECMFSIFEQQAKNVVLKSVGIDSKSGRYFKKIQSMIDRFDMQHHSQYKHISDDIMDFGTCECTISFLAGLFNTDGGYNKQSNYIEYYTTSKKLAYDIKYLLLKIGIYSYVSSKKIKYEYKTKLKVEDPMSHTVVIRQKSSLEKFEKIILPFMVGKKHNEFKEVINESRNKELYYDFLLGKYYTDEIKSSLKSTGVSSRELGKRIGTELKIFDKITNRNAEKIVKEIYVPDTYKALRSDYFPVKVISIEYAGKRNVFDIEVEGNHNYIANNLIVHNCIGKKDAETMKELKGRFSDGLEKKGWSEKDVDNVWHLMELQAGYSFNKSHSCAYGLLSYLTAYLKYHYTLEFQTALLNSVIGDYPQITRYISDSNQNGIKVLPPHINKSGQQFTFDNETGTIRFGFEAIKGIGEEISEKILEIRPFKSIDDIKERLKPKVSQYIALIKSGAIGTSKEKLLNEFIGEKTKRKEYKPVASLPTLKKLREEFGIESNSKEERLLMYNELKRIDHERKEDVRVKKEQDECQRKYWGVDKRLWEFEALSMFVTNNPFEYVNTLDFTQEEFIPNLVTVGVIADIQSKKDKKGRKFVFFDLFTKHGKIEATCFSSDYVKYQMLIEKGKAVVVKGMYKGESKSYVVNGMKDFFKWELEKKHEKK